MLELLSAVSLYNFAFYFGATVLAITVLLAAWRSTHVPGLQNITVVVLQHPSGRQTVERFTSTRRASTNTEDEVGLQEELYEEITLTAEDDDDGDDAEDDDEHEEDSVAEVADIENSSSPHLSSSARNDSVNSSLQSERSLRVKEINTGAAMDGISSSSSHSTTAMQRDSLNNYAEASSTSSDKNNPLNSASSLSKSSDSSTFIVESSSPKNGDAIDNSLGTKLNTVIKQKSGGVECITGSEQENKLEAGSNQNTTSLPPALEEACAVISGPSLLASIADLTSSEPSVELNVPTLNEEDSPKLEKNKLAVDSHESSVESKEPSTESIPVQEHVCPPGSIRIRLKYLDERQKTVFAQPTQNLICFKRNHFNSELAEHRVIRLIFNGRLLKPDTSTLQECGLFDNCVVHCHVSQPKPPSPPSQAAGEEAGDSGGGSGQQRRTRAGRRRWLHFLWHASVPDALHDEDAAAQGLDLSNYMSALLWLVVAGLWFMRFKHSYMFSTFSTFMLIFLTMLLVVPHYIFSVDVQLSVNLDGNTMRNLGIDRVVVLERLRGRRESSARRGRSEDDETSVRLRNSTHSESNATDSGQNVASANTGLSGSSPSSSNASAVSGTVGGVGSVHSTDSGSAAVENIRDILSN